MPWSLSVGDALTRMTLEKAATSFALEISSCMNLLPHKASAEGGLYLKGNWLLWSVYDGLLWSVYDGLLWISI